MKITLRRESKLPYWFTIDGSVHLTPIAPEAIIDENTLTDASKREIQAAHATGKLLIDDKISPTAETVTIPPKPQSETGVVEGYIQDTIDLGKLNVKEAKEVIKGCKDFKTILKLATQEQEGFARKSVMAALTAKAKELESQGGPVEETEQELIVLGTT